MNNSKKRSKSTKRKNKKLSGVTRDGNAGLPLANQRIMSRPLEVQFPDKLRVTLSFTEFIQQSIAIGNNNTTQRFRPTNAFDVDPVLGSTAVPGFTEMAALYSTYRVVASSIKLETVQNGTQSMVSSVVVPLNADPGASPSATVVQSWFSTFHSKRAGLANLGGPVAIIRNEMTTERIFGTKAVYFDDNFSAPVSGGPTNNWFWAIGWVSGGNAVGSAIVVTGNVEIRLDVEFFNRIMITT